MDQRGKLLIIDDDQALSEALNSYLTRSGYEVVSADDGAKGLHKLHSERPDLVILDVIMPGMTGWDVCRRIREVAHVPIIILTACGQRMDRVMALKLGADEYYPNPSACENSRRGYRLCCTARASRANRGDISVPFASSSAAFL